MSNKLFKRFAKTNDVSEEHQEKTKPKKTKSQKNDFYLRNKLSGKKRLFYKGSRFFIKAVILLGLLGGLLSFKPQTYFEFADEVVTESAFVTEYVGLMYTQKPTVQQTERISAFQLGEWSLNFDSNYSFELKKVNIYAHERLTDDTTRYYMTIQTHSKAIADVEPKEINAVQSIFIDVARKDNQFLVISPVNFIATDYTPIIEKSNYRKIFTANNMAAMTQDETARATNSIKLFLQAYDNDLDQAKTFFADPNILKARNGAKYDLATFNNIAAYKDKETYFFSINILEKSQNVSIQRTINFKIDIKTEKITYMEVN